MAQVPALRTPTESDGIELHVRRHITAELNLLSRHTGCPEACAVGAILALLRHRLSGLTRIGADLQFEGSSHAHVYDFRRPTSVRGLLGQRSLDDREQAGVWIRIDAAEDGDGLRVAVRDFEPEPDRSRDALASLSPLIDDAVGFPDRPVHRLSLLDAEQRHQVLFTWNQTDRSYPATATVCQLFEEQVVRTPLSVAVADAACFISYRDLNERANRLARLLMRLGVSRGSLVGLHLSRTVNMVAALLAVLKAGAAYVPLDPRYPPARIRHMISDSGARVVLSEQVHAETLPREHNAVVTVDGDVGALVDIEPADNLKRCPGADDLAYVIYTSGSTGTPKGVQIEHCAVVNFLLSMTELLGLDGGDCIVAITSLSFDIAVLELLAPLIIGGRVVIATTEQAQDGRRLAELLRRSGATLMQATPSTWNMLIGAGRVLPPITALCGGEPMPPSLAHQLLRSVRTLWNMYGPTETTVWSTARQIGEGECDNPPVGRPIANTHTYVLDEQGEPLPIGFTGELWIGGAGVARGYLNRPGLTAERFAPNPFRPGEQRIYRTGDLARFRPGGVIEVLGRRDQQIKLWGHRVELGEIEAALMSSPGISQAVVDARDSGGESAGETWRLVAYVVRSGTEISEEELRTHLADRLPAYMLPSRMVFLPRLPLLPNGKVDRAALAERVPAPLPPVPTDEPPDTLEEAVAALWREILQVSVVRPTDDFFALGGTSLGAGVLMNKLEQLTGEVVYVSAIFNSPTLGQFCGYLRQEYPQSASRLAGGSMPSLAGDAPPQAKHRRIGAAMLQEFRRTVTGLPPAPGGDARIPRAALILSAPRSGSTLLRVMLAGSPQLFVPPELELLGFDAMKERAEVLRGKDSYARDGLVRAFREILSCDPDAAHRFVEEHERDHSVAEIYRLLQARTPGRLLVDKTTTYAMDASALQRAEQIFEEPLYIHLVRHPGAMIHSYEQARLDQVFRHPHSFTPRELAELIWITSNQNIEEFFESIPPARRLQVRFEDLLEQSGPTLDGIAQFLGVQSDDRMLDPYTDRRARMADGVHPESRMAGDFKFARFDRVEVEVADAWRDHFDAASLCLLSRALAGKYGYHDLEQEGRKARSAALTPQQRGVYLHQKLSGEPTLYNICRAWRLRGDLEPLALRAALDLVVHRHEALRTTIREEDGVAVQSVDPVTGAAIDWIDLSSDDRGDNLERTLAEFAAARLDLETGPLFRVCVIRLGEQEHVLALLAHHVVVDGSSLPIILRHFWEAYAAALAGTELFVQPQTQYIDVTERFEGDGDSTSKLEFWRRTLGQAPPLLTLPSDRSRPFTKKYRGGRLPMTLSDEDWQRVGDFARAEGATLFVTLLTGFVALLSRYTHTAESNRLVVGTAFANRQRFEDEHVVGMFTGTLPLATRVDDDPTFRQLLGRVRQTCVDAYEHAIPFDELVRHLGKDRDASYSPIVQVLFTSEPPLAQELTPAGLEVEELDIDWCMSKFDLTVSLVTAQDRLDGWWEFDAEMFDDEQVRRWVGHYVNLLRGVVADPDRAISEYDLLDVAEREQAVRRWNATKRVWLTTMSVEEAIRLQVERCPDAAAVEGAGQVLSYADLGVRSDHVAARLIAEGVGPEDVVGILCDRAPWFIVGCLGVLKSGAAYLPIDPSGPAKRIEHVLRDAGVRVALTRANSPSALPESVTQLEVDTLPPDLISFAPRPRVDGNQLAYVIYTSGSAGQPKGVLIEHHSLENFVRWFVDEYRLGPGDRCTQTMNTGFDVCVMELWPTLAAGATLVMAPPEALIDPTAMWRWLSEVGATVSCTVTPLLEAMLSAPVPTDVAVRMVMVGGDRLHPQPGISGARFTLVNAYGPTENTIVSTTGVVRAEDGAFRPPPIGRPVPNTTAYILDGRMGPVPIGVEGELYLGGCQVARGYLNQPELTNEHFLPDPFSDEPGARLYRSGDRARHRADGSIEYLGRTDDQVKIRGFRIEPGEIEAVLKQVDGVRDAVVLPVGTRDRWLHGFFIGGPSVTPESLREALERHLPSFMVPSRFTRLESIPLTANGKVDRRTLEVLTVSRPGQDTRGPMTEFERALLGLWRRVLGNPDLAVRDSFFEHGGHSLNAMRLLSLIREKTGWGVELPILFAAPSARDMARVLELSGPGGTTVRGELGTGAAHLVQLQPRGGRVPLFCVHPSDGSILCYAPLREICSPDQPVWALQALGPAASFASIESLASTYVQAVRTVCPAGPIHLLGWSFGGLIAFEMARQFELDGRPLGSVVLLDSKLLPRPDTPEDSEADLREFASQLQRRSQPQATVDSAMSVVSAADDPWLAFIGLARARGWVDVEVDEGELRRAFDTFRSHLAVGRAYEPRLVSVPLTLYLAESDQALCGAQVQAWAALTTGGVKVTQLTGDHFDAVAKPALRVVVAGLEPTSASGQEAPNA